EGDVLLEDDDDVLDGRGRLWIVRHARQSEGRGDDRGNGPSPHERCKPVVSFAMVCALRCIKSVRDSRTGAQNARCAEGRKRSLHWDDSPQICVSMRMLSDWTTPKSFRARTTIVS